jgi:hypothetical protein
MITAIIDPTVNHKSANLQAKILRFEEAIMVFSLFKELDKHKI